MLCLCLGSVAVVMASIVAALDVAIVALDPTQGPRHFLRECILVIRLPAHTLRHGIKTLTDKFVAIDAIIIVSGWLELTVALLAIGRLHASIVGNHREGRTERGNNVQSSLEQRRKCFIQSRDKAGFNAVC